jgi:hypothetical protein
MIKSEGQVKVGLDDMKVGLAPKGAGFYQLFFVDEPSMEQPFPIMIGYSFKGKVDVKHFPKEDIIIIEN